MIQAKVVADSINEQGNRIATMVVTMPRIILAEFNTHRMFSRNSASSRAIPFKKMVKAIEQNPFIPIAWQKDHSGMQGTIYFENKSDIDVLEDRWRKARRDAVDNAFYLYNSATVLEEGGVTKQLCNRLLEPFMWHTVIVTATEWENFFALRCPNYVTKSGTSHRSRKDFLDKCSNEERELKRNEVDWLKLNTGKAEIHMMALAEAMYDAYNESTPQKLSSGEWHVPFMREIDYTKLQSELGGNSSFECEELMVKISTVMCARVSYTVVGEDQKPLSYERMVQIHDELLAANPKHMSPFEHCAKAMSEHEYNWLHGTSGGNVEGNGLSGNFRGFVQYRKTIQGENITK